jgi:hypothetical protein
MGCQVFVGFTVLFYLFTEACLGPTVILGTDVAVLPFLLVFVTPLGLEFTMAESGLGYRLG